MPVGHSELTLPGDRESGRELSPFPNQCPGVRTIALHKEGGRLSSRLEPGDHAPFPWSSKTRCACNPPLPAPAVQRLWYFRLQQDAALLAADLRNDHRNDLFRQLLYRVLALLCHMRRRGVVREEVAYRIGRDSAASETSCQACSGSGYADNPSPLGYQELRSGVIDLQVERDIDPTVGHVPNPFKKLSEESGEVYREALTAFDISAGAKSPKRTSDWNRWA